MDALLMRAEAWRVSIGSAFSGFVSPNALVSIDSAS
jgi:hypothetical protein